MTAQHTIYRATSGLWEIVVAMDYAQPQVCGVTTTSHDNVVSSVPSRMPGSNL
ncbi:hypothetical protein H4R34_001926 [Dimargaris verticillata]|uniref:Uncharacterized protein n=1 Tax=Dimargaris verticillata TaxID=2761393 RepID=A0A9W8EEJ1_9FUNG|nr:hypothetical protein H4R34_001926 [Dimargaris verticillata]